MKTRLFTCMILLSLCVIAVEAKIKGNGKIITKEVRISDYKSLSVKGNFSWANNSFQFMNNKQGPVFNYSQKSGRSSLTVTIDENLFSLLDINSSNGELSIRVEENKQIAPTRLEINSNSSQLEKLQISGSIDFNLQTPLTGKRLEIKSSGASDVYMQQRIQVDDCELTSSGASDTKFSNLNCKTIEVISSGASDVHLKGKADIGEFNVSGSSDINGYDFILKELSCKASGSSDIKTHVTDRLEARASGSSDIKYKGDPKTNTDASSASDIDRVR